MKRLFQSEAAMAAAVLAVVVVAIFAAHFVAAYFESTTYNRLTGASTTTWDALFVELRVEGEVER